jgi:hypothetical protein
MGRLDLALYDREVVCDPVTEVCSLDGAPVEADSVRSWAFMSTETTRFAPEGFYLYSELHRTDGVEVELEIDLPLVDDPAEATGLYRERTGGEVTFESTHLRGGVQLARDLEGDRCECLDGRLELVFVDPGPDGVVETDDDAIRHLSRGRFSWDTNPCIHSRVLSIQESGLDITRNENCPWEPPGTPPRTEPDPDPPSSTDPFRDSTWDDTGCDASCGSSSSSSSGGCEDDSGCDSSGCEGDTSDSSGCEGDSGGSCSDDPACESGGSTASMKPRCRRRGFRFGGPAQTFALTGLVVFYFRKRAFSIR